MGTTIAVYRELSKNIFIQLPIRKSYQLGARLRPLPIDGIGPNWVTVTTSFTFWGGLPRVSPQRNAGMIGRFATNTRRRFLFPKYGIHAILQIMMIEMRNRAEMLLRACRAKVRWRREPSDGAVAGKLGTFALQKSELMLGSYFSQTVLMLHDEPALAAVRRKRSRSRPERARPLAARVAGKRRDGAECASKTRAARQKYLEIAFFGLDPL
jgi:hypothetical protein